MRPLGIDRDMASSVASQVLSSGFNFAIGILAARLLGVADFGLFTLILLFVHLLAGVEGNLISVPMMTLAGSRANRSAGYFAAALAWGGILAMGSAILVCLLIVMLFGLRGEELPNGLLMAAIVVTLGQNTQTMLRRVLFATGARQQAVAMDALRLGLVALFVVLALIRGIDVTLPGLFYVIGGSALLTALPFCRNILTARIRPLLLKALMIRHWPISRWFLLLLAVSVGQEQLTWLIVGIRLGDEAVGGLRAAQYLLGTTHFLLLALENFLPRNAAIAYREGGLAQLKRYLIAQTWLIGGMSLALIAVIAVFSEPLLALVFGADYAPYASMTAIFALSYGLIVIRSIWVYYLRVIEDARSVFLAFLTASIAALAAIFPAITHFGLPGVAWTLVLAQVFCLGVIALAVFRNERRHAS